MWAATLSMMDWKTGKKVSFTVVFHALIWLIISDNEADIGSDDNTEVVNKTVGGVRSFGIDDILNHSSKGDRNKNVKKPSQGRSPLDALFTMTTNFDSLKQKQGEPRVCVM